MTRWFQIKKLSTTKFHNFSRSTTVILAICPSEVVYKIWISNLKNSNVGFVGKTNSILKVFNYIVVQLLKIYNFFFIICSSDIKIVTLFTNVIYLFSSFRKLHERSRFYEQHYYRFVEWRNDQNKSCISWEVIQLCSWTLFNLN